MKSHRSASLLTAALLGAALIGGPAAADDGADELSDFISNGGNGEISNTATNGTSGEAFDPNAPATVPVGEQPGGTSEPYEEIAPPDPMLCDAEFDDGTIGDCSPAIPEIAEEAEDEAEDLTPADVEAAILTAFQSLPVDGSPITYQPEGDWALVNMDFIVYTDTATQNLGTTILGVPVTFELTPTHWTWDFGDGTTMPSSNPGAAYPNHTLSHVYSSAHDGVTVSLTTLWSGEFQIGGAGDWYPVDGFVTTTGTTGPIEIVAMDVHLVPNDT